MEGSKATDPHDDPSAQLAQHLTDIARVLLSPGTVAQILSRIVTLSVAAIDGCDEAGLCERTAGRAVLPVASGLVADLDLLQDSLSEGPCVDAFSGLDSVYVADLHDDARWPRFSPLAAEAGMRSALAYRLAADGRTLGALQLYARLPGAFNATERAQGLLFAAHAGIALGVAHGQAADRNRTDHLQKAMDSRETIGQAQGILMERERITAEQAFALLRRSSQHLNVRLRDVAQELVDTGLLPGTGPD